MTWKLVGSGRWHGEEGGTERKVAGSGSWWVVECGS